MLAKANLGDVKNENVNHLWLGLKWEQESSSIILTALSSSLSLFTHQTWYEPGSGPTPAQTLPRCPAEQHAHTRYGCWRQSGRSCGTSCVSAEGLQGCGRRAGWSLERDGSVQQQHPQWSSQTCRWRTTGRPESWHPGERGPCLLSTGHHGHRCGHLQKETINALGLRSSKSLQSCPAHNTL